MTSIKKIVQKVILVTIIWVIAFALNFSFLAAPAVALNHCPKRYPVNRTRPTGLGFSGSQKPKEIPIGVRPIFPRFQSFPYFFPAGVGYPGTYFFPTGIGYSGAYSFSTGASYPKPCCKPVTPSGQKPQIETTINPTPPLSTAGTPGTQNSQTETTSNSTSPPSTTDDEGG